MEKSVKEMQKIVNWNGVRSNIEYFRNLKNSEQIHWIHTLGSQNRNPIKDIFTPTVDMYSGYATSKAAEIIQQNTWAEAKMGSGSEAITLEHVDSSLFGLIPILMILLNSTTDLNNPSTSEWYFAEVRKKMTFAYTTKEENQALKKYQQENTSGDWKEAYYKAYKDGKISKLVEFDRDLKEIL